jgi:hypothetical protein
MSSMRSAPSSPTPQVESATGEREVRVSPELEAELLEAMAQADRGEYIELTPQQLARWVETGEFPWSDDESLG